MHPDPGAPVALAGARASLDASRTRRIPFELLAAITIVGVAAAGHFAAAALVAAVVASGHVAAARWPAAWRARPRASQDDDGRETSLPAPATAPRWSLVERALTMLSAWFMPLAIALSAAVLMRTGDVAFALTLLLVASPQALLALPTSSRIEWRALAALAAAALLAATLAGFVGLVAAALLQQASMLVARVVDGDRRAAA
ncbi:MAG TPA: hypothetical protein VGE10_05125 [Zeimonas sp.]